jgi:hypothetical protein
MARSEDPHREEMARGYLDGYDLDAPEPSANRSACYRHGFANGRAEKLHKWPRASYDVLMRLADEAIAADMASTMS